MRRTPALSPILLPCLALLVCASPTARAATEDVPFEDLVRYADLIVVAGVLEGNSEFNQARETIYTFWPVGISQTVKGTPPSMPLIDVRVEGGEVDGVVLGTEAEADLEQGEQVVLFLSKEDADTFYTVFAGALGHYRVDRGIVEETGQTLADFLQEIDDILNP